MAQKKTGGKDETKTHSPKREQAAAPPRESETTDGTNQITNAFANTGRVIIELCTCKDKPTGAEAFDIQMHDTECTSREAMQAGIDAM